jgi:hypothetical protein
MVMDREQKGASHGHATTTDGITEVGAAAGIGAESRPRLAALRARALCRAAEDRRGDDGACGRPPRPLEAARSRHRLRLSTPVYAWVAHYHADGLAGLAGLAGLTGHRHGG